jgi:hypothetical protein
MTMCMQGMFVASLVLLSCAQTSPPTLPTLSPADEATPCGAAFTVARNKTVDCFSNALNDTQLFEHGALNEDQAQDMVCITCQAVFDFMLPNQNAAKGCTNASSTITAQIQLTEAALKAACYASKSFKYGKNAAIGLGIFGTVCLCCFCACCIWILMKCCGSKKKRGRQEEADEEEEEEDIE